MEPSYLTAGVSCGVRADSPSKRGKGQSRKNARKRGAYEQSDACMVRRHIVIGVHKHETFYGAAIAALLDHSTYPAHIRARPITNAPRMATIQNASSINSPSTEPTIFSGDPMDIKMPI